MRSERPNEIRVGLFIATALALGLLAIWSVGSAQNLLVRRDPFFISVPNAAGIAPGAKVTISGVSAGTVDSFSLKHEDQNVRVHLSISSQLEEFIKKDSFAEVITEGVLGDKLIAIAAGSSSS
ncbi:MAG: MlaD family protein, partial [Bdellovibrionota bacterium]